MINTLVVDDDAAIYRLLKTFFQSSKQLSINWYAPDLGQARKLLELEKPDLVFLDIDLPDGSGFELIDEQTDFNVIFVTAHNDFATKAFECAALDYIMKPINETRLQASIDRLTKPSVPDWHTKFNVFSANNNASDGEKKILIGDQEGYELVRLKDIVRCQAYGNYTYIHTTSGEKQLSSKTLKEYEMLLGSFGFFRCHQSHLINGRHITGYRKLRSLIKLSDGETVELARSKKQAYKEFVNSHILPDS